MPLTYITNPGGTSVSVTFNSCDVGTITIPNTFGGLPVVGINQGAFLNCTTLTGIVISNNITGIGESAFRGCSNLTGYKMSENLIYLGASGFMNCTNLSGAIIPTGIREINELTFKSCTNLKSLVIPNNIRSINTEAFDNCSNITGDVYFPKNLTGIGDAAFENCFRIEDVIFSRDINYLGSNVFNDCSNLSGAYFLGNQPNITGSNIFNAVNSNFRLYRYMYLTDRWSDPTGFQGKRIASIENFNTSEIKSNVFESNGNTGIVQIVATGSTLNRAVSKNFSPTDIKDLSIWLDASSYQYQGSFYVPYYVILIDSQAIIPTIDGTYFEDSSMNGIYYVQDGGPNFIEYIFVDGYWYLYDDFTGDYVAYTADLYNNYWEDYGYGCIPEVLDYDFSQSYEYPKWTFPNRAASDGSSFYTPNIVHQISPVQSIGGAGGKSNWYVASAGGYDGKLVSSNSYNVTNFTLFVVTKHFQSPGVGNVTNYLLAYPQILDVLELGVHSLSLIPAPTRFSFVPIKYYITTPAGYVSDLNTSYPENTSTPFSNSLTRPIIICITRTLFNSDRTSYKYYIKTSNSSTISSIVVPGGQNKREVFIRGYTGYHYFYYNTFSNIVLFSHPSYNGAYQSNNTDMIGDLLHYSRVLNDAEIARVFSWLSKKYNI